MLSAAYAFIDLDFQTINNQFSEELHLLTWGGRASLS